MATATGMFAATFRMQLAGYSNGTVITTALVLVSSPGCCCRRRVFGRRTHVRLRSPSAQTTQTAMADALIPGRAKEDTPN